MAKIVKENNKLIVPDTLTLPYIEGDGVGAEITNVCKNERAKLIVKPS